jgi:hypothetical protein
MEKMDIGLQNHQTKYLTKDFYEAAFLCAKKQKLLGLKQEQAGKYFWFVFENNNNCCEKLANSYWAGTSTVNAKAYSNALRSLKDRLFSQR